MSRWPTPWLTVLALLAFAGNSLLCRRALATAAIDPALFTLVRLLAGALVLGLIVRWRGGMHATSAGSGWSALALFGYAAMFSFAYVSLEAGAGALLLFGAVQATMIGYAVLGRGARLHGLQVCGCLLAMVGLVWLCLPGLSAPPLSAALLMLGAGIAWGVYSLRGSAGADPTATTAANFLRSVPLAAALALAAMPGWQWSGTGLWLAALSGGLTSGLGYALWYSALPGMSATSAAVLQLSVPVLTALGGVLLLGEAASPRLLGAGLCVLGGIVLVLSFRGVPR